MTVAGGTSLSSRFRPCLDGPSASVKTPSLSTPGQASPWSQRAMLRVCNELSDAKRVLWVFLWVCGGELGLEAQDQTCAKSKP